jgi:hypothetical protein
MTMNLPGPPAGESRSKIDSAGTTDRHELMARGNNLIQLGVRASTSETGGAA